MVTLVAVTGRRSPRSDKWPYSGANVSPRGYFESVVRAGGQPVLVDDAPDPKALLERFDALLLTGGPDVDPAVYGQDAHDATYGVSRRADDFECALADAATARAVPTLAICRGFQILNVARGGTMFQHILENPGVPAHGEPGVLGGGREHDVRLDADSLLADVMEATTVKASCHHHQAVDQLGDGLRVVGRAADGIVEAMELDGQFVLAVQWHPEDIAADDPPNQRLFDALIRKAERP